VSSLLEDGQVCDAALGARATSSSDTFSVAIVLDSMTWSRELTFVANLADI
jgi:hypothetical protein